jgi:hypothetical protein
MRAFPWKSVFGAMQSYSVLLILVMLITWLIKLGFDMSLDASANLQ